MRIAALAFAATLAVTGAAQAQYSTYQPPGRTTAVPPSTAAPSATPKMQAGQFSTEGRLASRWCSDVDSIPRWWPFATTADPQKLGSAKSGRGFSLALTRSAPTLPWMAIHRRYIEPTRPAPLGTTLKAHLADRLVQVVPAPGRARGGRTSRSLWCRPEAPRLAATARVLALWRPGERFRRQRLAR